MSKVKIQNLSTYKIGINLPNVRFRRDINPKQTTVLPEDVFEDFNYDPGCIAFVRDGFLKIITEDEEILEQVTKPEQMTADVVDVPTLLTISPVSELIKVIKDATPALKDTIITEAVRLNVTDEGRCNVIKKFLGVDVLDAIAMARKE